MLITNAKIITVSGKSYENGFIYIESDKFVAVGEMENLPDYENEEIIDCAGAFVLPGFIDAHCHIGMWEDGLGSEGDDGNEMTDPVTPNLRAIDAINAMDRCFDEALDAGITTVVTGPGSANVIAGQMVAMKTFGNRIDDMIIKSPVAMKMALGENPKKVYGEKKVAPSTRMASASIMRETLFAAKQYLSKKQSAMKDNNPAKLPPFNMKYESLIPVLERRLKAHIHCHRADDIFTAIRVAKEFNLDYVLVHCTEGHLIAQQLKQENVNAIIGPIISDRSKPELINADLKNAVTLEDNGVPFAICTDHNVVPIQYLNISAGLCVREGLPFMSAIEALTLRPAKICGIDDEVGSITEGKKANFSIFAGDPLSIYAKPKMVFVDGIKVRG